MQTSSIERTLRKQGFSDIAGVDEAGRGPLAGPVFAAAVMLPEDAKINGLDDSKKLSPSKREQVFNSIMKKATCVGVGICGESDIDRINILQATFRAMAIAVSKLSSMPDMILVDGNKKVPQLRSPQKPVVRGDSKCACIAAASVVAKVLRDRYMMQLHMLYPQYGFDRNKGYGTEEHLNVIRKTGLSPAHRKSFVKNILR